MNYLYASLLGLLLLITACSTEGATPTPTPEPSKTQVRLELKTNATHGVYLTTEAGESLYLFTTDVKDSGASACNDACAATWPAFTLDSNSSEVAAGQGLETSKLSTFKRADGTTQIAYNGWPLYRFARDVNPGDINGQGVGGVWFLVTAEGKRVPIKFPTMF